MKNFRLVQRFERGYHNKRDITNIASDVLVRGSQNVIINDGEKIETRKGYTLMGAGNSDRTPINASYDWVTSRDTELNLRAGGSKLQFMWKKNSETWVDLIDDASRDRFKFVEWWDNSKKIDLLLFVNGGNDIYEWNGAVTTFKEATTDTITKEGDRSWAEEGFYLTANKTIVINGTEYTYTGGENTTTLTGVSPDPTIQDPAIGTLIHQQYVVHTDTPGANFSNDIIGVMYNQLYVGSFKERFIFISDDEDFTDYTVPSTARQPGDPASLTPDVPPIGFVAQEENMYVSGRKNQWYKISFELDVSGDLPRESMFIRRLKTGPQQGAIEQDLIGNAKNNVIYVSKEPTLDELGRIESIDTPRSRPLSDTIKTDFNNTDFTGGDIIYFKGSVYISAPNEDIVYIYDIERGLWQPPQVLPIKKFAIIDDELYGHSSRVFETYKLFDGTSDNGNGFIARANLAYRNYGNRSWKKVFDEWYTEGYISAPTNLKMRLLYDWKGFNSNRDEEIRGDDKEILFEDFEDGSFGKDSFGKSPLGSINESVPGLGKFRIIHTGVPEEFYEIQVQYESEGIDNAWEILACGANVKASRNDNVSIKK